MSDHHIADEIRHALKSDSEEAPSLARQSSRVPEILWQLQPLFNAFSGLSGQPNNSESDLSNVISSSSTPSPNPTETSMPATSISSQQPEDDDSDDEKNPPGSMNHAELMEQRWQKIPTSAFQPLLNAIASTPSQRLDRFVKLADVSQHPLVKALIAQLRRPHQIGLKASVRKTVRTAVHRGIVECLVEKGKAVFKWIRLPTHHVPQQQFAAPFPYPQPNVAAIPQPFPVVAFSPLPVPVPPSSLPTPSSMALSAPPSARSDNPPSAAVVPAKSKSKPIPAAYRTKPSPQPHSSKGNTGSAHAAAHQSQPMAASAVASAIVFDADATLQQSIAESLPVDHESSISSVTTSSQSQTSGSKESMVKLVEHHFDSASLPAFFRPISSSNILLSGKMSSSVLGSTQIRPHHGAGLLGELASRQLGPGGQWLPCNPSPSSLSSLSSSSFAAAEPNQHAYLNTAEPFCFVAVGVQGSGKSHSMAVLLENCVLGAAVRALKSASTVASSSSSSAAPLSEEKSDNAESDYVDGGDGDDNAKSDVSLAATSLAASTSAASSSSMSASPSLPFLSSVIQARTPITTLVLHYDQNQHSVCEAISLIRPSPALMESVNRDRAAASDQDESATESTASLSSSSANVGKFKLPPELFPHLPAHQMVVLVSPSFFHQRRAFYAGYCTVRPLLFAWSSLTAQQIKVLMRITESDQQLYMSTMLNMLRQFQRQGALPSFGEFKQMVEKACNVPGQGGPLRQRLSLLESFVAESDLNSQDASFADAVDFAKLLSDARAGALFVADLTDPMLSPAEANSIFQVLLQQFREKRIRGGGGKLVALDEAHKYMESSSSDGLSRTIVDMARLMRHDGLRLALSTQSPKSLAPELLELVSVALIHNFHSSDWFSHLSAKIPLSASAFAEVRRLSPGQALMFVSRHSINQASPVAASSSSSRNRSDQSDVAASSSSSADGDTVDEDISAAQSAFISSSDISPLLRVVVRPRLTADFGASKRHG